MVGGASLKAGFDMLFVVDCCLRSGGVEERSIYSFIHPSIHISIHLFINLSIPPFKVHSKSRSRHISGHSDWRDGVLRDSSA